MSRIRNTDSHRCGKTFATKLDLERHERFKHYACGRHRFTCAACLRVFASRLGLANHERAVHIGLPHTCPQPGCDKRFMSERDLRDHENCHTRARSFLCPDCGDTFLSSKQMANHRERHKVRNGVQDINVYSFQYLLDLYGTYPYYLITVLLIRDPVPF